MMPRRSLTILTAISFCLLFGLDVCADAAAKRKNKVVANVDMVALENISGDVRVRVHEADTTIVELSGEAGLEDYFDIRTANNKMLIRQKPDLHLQGSQSSVAVVGGNVVSVTSGGTSTVIIGNQKFESNPAKHVDLKLTILVPAGQAFSIEGPVRSAVIGDIEGRFDADIAGAGRVTVGKVGPTKLRASGAVTFEAAAVDGDLSLVLSGDGRVSVRSGAIRRLQATLLGAGNVSVGGTVQDADISIVGAGQIEIERINTKPRISIIGAGDARFTVVP